MIDFDHLFEYRYYELLSVKEVKELEDRFIEEPLFQACSLNLYNRKYESKLTPTEIWYIATCFCLELGRKKNFMETAYPILFHRLQETIASMIDGNFVYSIEPADMVTILACIDVMLRCSLEKEQAGKMHRIVEKCMMTAYHQRETFQGYRLGNLMEPKNIFGMSVEEQRLRVVNYLVKREWMQKESKESATEDEDVHIPAEPIDVHDKVRLDLALKLMEKDGANLNKHGNKTIAAKVLHTITGLPMQTCKNYCSNRDLNTTEHSEEILTINSQLQALSMETRL